MKEENTPMIKFAMHYGALLGLFWMFKYTFLIVTGFTSDLFLFLYYVLNIGTFFLIYVFYFKYKFADAEKSKEMGYCLIFVILMCFFASFFEGALMYAHYQFIHPEAFEAMVQQNLKAIEYITKIMPNYPQESINMMETMFSSKVYYITGLFLGNLIVGMFLGLVIGIFSRNIKNIKPS